MSSVGFFAIILVSLIVFLMIASVFFFKNLSNQIIKHNQQGFLDLANSQFEKREQAIHYLVNPLKESLEKFGEHVRELEKSRVGAYAGLSTQVKSLCESQLQLRSETTQLVNALKKPHVRGRWGEIQLQRVVELAGMLENCDFYQQQTLFDQEDSGQRLRPDLLIRLPGGKNIVVDAKVPLSSFLESLEKTDPEQQKIKLQEHARHIREHIKKLSLKNYWEQFNPAPEFVVLFLPGETFFSAALEADPTLIEQGVDKQVILATPTTLIALLKSVAYGWREENLAQNAQKISTLGKELSKRLVDFRENFAGLGDRLDKTLQSYNKLIGQFEGRVLVSARKFQSLNTGETSSVDALSPVETIEITARKIPETAYAEDEERI